MLQAAPTQAVPERMPAGSCTAGARAILSRIGNALPPGTGDGRLVYLRCGEHWDDHRGYGMRHIDAEHGPGPHVDINFRQVTECVRAIAENYRPRIDHGQWRYRTTGATRWRLLIDPQHNDRGVVTVFAENNNTNGYRPFNLCPGDV
ncbi:hypothetical protein FM076_30070 [Streptomyces albus subsp. chlorinus]|uniref:hypothetical protein n=1 Tax=Streptomyces albus TaxID=1888 RepID=UPI00156F9DDA|nr:hypothetical protein [Streptomyces albus]NSC25179.1 hypothetical protein [Streptomyces albus subsp. chlorinus]